MGIFSKIISQAAQDELDRLMTEKIRKFSGKPFASFENERAFAKYNALAGFKFLEITILANYEVKTFRGGQVTFSNKEKRLTVETDSMEIETDYSNTLSLGMTRLEIDITEELVDFINKTPVSDLEITIDNIPLLMKISDLNLLREVINTEDTSLEDHY